MTITVVKHSYIQTADFGRGRARAHIRYLQHRPGKDRPRAEPRPFFNDMLNDIHHQDIFTRLESPRRGPILVHKLIISPGPQDTDVQDFTRVLMTGLSKQMNRDLEWYAVEHHNTQHPHAHVIIMGRDRQGWPVRLRKQHYTALREAGDEYLRTRGLLDKPRPKEDSRSRSVFTAIRRAARQAYERLIKRQEESEQSWRLQDLLPPDDGDKLGSLPPPEVLAQLAQKRLNRAQRVWKQYSAPIKINYGQSRSQPVQFTWQSSLRSLRQLEREYLNGDPYVTKSITPKEFQKLKQWIKHRFHDDQKVEADAANIRCFELTFPAGDTMLLDSKSNPQQLRQLTHMHERGEIFLQDCELRALNTWIVNSVHRGADDIRSTRALSRPRQSRSLPDIPAREPTLPTEFPTDERNPTALPRRWRRQKHRLPPR